jgi:hypothetical protein
MSGCDVEGTQSQVRRNDEIATYTAQVIEGEEATRFGLCAEPSVDLNLT